MADVEELLSRIGLTEGESRVYLALLELGESSIGAIIREAQVSNSKVYNIIERLQKKGLASTVVKRGLKSFAAADPSRLEDMLGEKERELAATKKSLTDALPKLEEMKRLGPAEEMRVFEGVRGVKVVVEELLDLLKEGDTFYILGAPRAANEAMEGYFADWHARRSKKKIKCKILYNEDSREFGKERKKLPYTEAKYLPNEIVTPGLIDIAGDHIIMIIFGARILAIVIRNKEMADSYLTYFNYFWKIAKK